MQKQTNTQATTAAAAVVLTHDVENFDVWKTAFDRHASARRSAGILSTHIARHADNPNRVSVYLAASDADKLAAFVESTGLMTAMRDAGVKGSPHTTRMTPIDDLTVKGRPLPGVIIRHEVQEFGAWKKAFDRHASARAAAGILGHAVNRSRENPNVVVIYLQAESLDALRAFASSSDVKQAMKAAGVVGAPDLTFVLGSEPTS